MEEKVLFDLIYSIIKLYFLSHFVFFDVVQVKRRKQYKKKRTLRDAPSFMTVLSYFY